MKRTASLTTTAVLLIAAATGAPEAPLPSDGPPPVAIPVPELLPADVHQHIGTYRVTSQIKVTDDRITRVAIKPMILRVTSNGTTVKVATEGRGSGASSYEIYRSDGIGRQNGHGGVLEVIPGVQGSSCQDGVLRHIRVTREALTITRFAGVSNQTVITHAVAVEQEAVPKVAASPASH